MSVIVGGLIEGVVARTRSEKSHLERDLDKPAPSDALPPQSHISQALQTVPLTGDQVVKYMSLCGTFFRQILLTLKTPCSSYNIIPSTWEAAVPISLSNLQCKTKQTRKPSSKVSSLLWGMGELYISYFLKSSENIHILPRKEYIKC